MNPRVAKPFKMNVAPELAGNVVGTLFPSAVFNTTAPVVIIRSSRSGPPNAILTRTGISNWCVQRTWPVLYN